LHRGICYIKDRQNYSSEMDDTSGGSWPSIFVHCCFYSDSYFLSTFDLLISRSYLLNCPTKYYSSIFYIDLFIAPQNMDARCTVVVKSRNCIVCSKFYVECTWGWKKKPTRFLTFVFYCIFIFINTFFKSYPRRLLP
jgi:hypothetical protein